MRFHVIFLFTGIVKGALVVATVEFVEDFFCR